MQIAAPSRTVATVPTVSIAPRGRARENDWRTVPTVVTVRDGSSARDAIAATPAVGGGNAC